MPPITRVELIDHSPNGEGRDFTRYYDNPITFALDLQDDGRTLKIFIKEQEPDVKLQKSDQTPTD